MKFNRKIMAAAVVLAGGSIALAHHLSTPLSYLFGSDVLSAVVYHATTGKVGVPAYVLSGGEIEGTLALSEGAAFAIADAAGKTDHVVFHATQFQDVGAATLDEVVASLNAQLTVATAFEDNGHLVLRGLEGGAQSLLDARDGQGSPLAALSLPSVPVHGSDSIALQLSIPADASGGPDLSGHPYFLIASRTPGTTDVGGKQLPIALDAATALVLRATAAGALPGFQGSLDAGSDAVAEFRPKVLNAIAGGAVPDHVYFAFAVLAKDLGKVEFVSNRFTLEIVP